MQPHTARQPCMICGGHRDLKQGVGERCWGFLSEDGDFAHCSRDELAGSIPQHPKTECYPHKLRGPCQCGVTHGDSSPVQIGEAKRARVVATYEYTDEQDEVLFRVIRKEPKAFLQQRPDGQWGRGDARLVPYRLSEILSAVQMGYEVFIAEGEKDAEAIRAAGAVATCNAGGAGKWLPEFARYLEGASVVIVADRDDKGMDHARSVYQSLKHSAKSIRVVQAASGKDAADHLAAGYGLDAFIPVYPIGDLRESDPIAWKRAILMRSLKPKEDPIVMVDAENALAQPPAPMWPSALEGAPSWFDGMTGVTFMVGGPSAGKTWWAIGSAVEAVRSGWRVLYLAAEMSPASILRRAMRYTYGDAKPDGFDVIEVSYGSSAERLVELVCEVVDERRTLIVLDSISSFVDQAQAMDANDDVHKIGPLKQLTMWALNVKRDSNGEISFLVLSERNAQGETKGRFGDHKADLVLSIKKDEDTQLGRRIEITKAWEQSDGSLGLYALNPRDARLRWVGI